MPLTILGVIVVCNVSERLACLESVYWLVLVKRSIGIFKDNVVDSPFSLCLVPLLGHVLLISVLVVVAFEELFGEILLIVGLLLLFYGFCLIGFLIGLGLGL